MNQDITNTVQQFFMAIDSQDWVLAERLMTDRFHLDYSSYGAGPAAELKPADVLGGWKGLLPGFDSTHHQLSPLAIVVDGNAAEVCAHVTGYHFIEGAEGGNLQTIAGSYILTLTRLDVWQISGITFKFKFEVGNLDLPEIARERVE